MKKYIGSYRHRVTKTVCKAPSILHSAPGGTSALSPRKSSSPFTETSPSGAKTAANAASGAKFSHVLARSAAIWESSEEAGISRYIAPNGAETSTIRQENDHLKNELFDIIGLTLIKETREVQSAESKAWDHQQVCQFLLNRVDVLEQTELAVWKLMNLYDPAIKVPEISYNRDFSLVDLQKSIAGLLDLRTVNAGKEYQKEIARSAVGMLNRCQKISPVRQQKIFDEIEQMDMNAGESENDK
jgi:hypothetical protein